MAKGKQIELFTIDLKGKWTSKYVISTGVHAFDKVLNGGIPSGRLTEINGPESTWKSLLSLQALAEAAKNEKLLVIYADTEHAISKGLVDMVGLDSESIMYLDIDKMESVENIFDSIEAGLDLAKAQGKYLVYGWDSVAATPGYEELTKEIGRNEAGMRRAKLIKSGLNKYMPRIAREYATLIFVNQLIERIGIQFGEATSTPGGRSIKYWASVRIQFKNLGRIKDDKTKEQIGSKGQMLVQKSKVGKPFGKVLFNHMVGESILKHAGLLDYLTRHGYLEQAGAYYNFVGHDENFQSKNFSNHFDAWEGKDDFLPKLKLDKEEKK